MSIIRLTGINGHNTIQDWINVIEKNPKLLYSPYKNRKTAPLDLLVWTLTHNIAPFMVFGVLFEDQWLLLSGVAELTVILSFLQGKTATNGHVLDQSSSIYYQQLPLFMQQNILGCQVPAVYCKAETSDDFRKLATLI